MKTNILKYSLIAVFAFVSAGAFVAFFLSLGIAHFLSGQLGGLTGDTYGFLTECGHVIYMLAAVYLLR